MLCASASHFLSNCGSSSIQFHNTTMMNTLMISPLPSSFISHRPKFYYLFHSTITSATSREHTPTPNPETLVVVDNNVVDEQQVSKTSTSSAPLLKKVAQKTASTFAPRSSTASKNPAVPGSPLYTVFEVQAYASMLFGGALSFNLIFPSDQPDLWRLMGMWSIWMFTIPSLRARDCSKNEKEALNYLFLLIPFINVLIPFFFKSFPLVWSADIIAFIAMYAWKFGWFHITD